MNEWEMAFWFTFAGTWIAWGFLVWWILIRKD